jgi:ABC-type amino acid transport substrate-binding protein
MIMHALFSRIDASPAQERAILAEVEKLSDRVHAAKAGVKDARGDLAAALRGPVLDDAALGAVLGRVDAAMSAVPTLQGAIDKGKPIQLLGDPVFFEPLGAAVDKSAPLDPTSFVEKLTEIIQAMHSDGTLTQLSNKWYGEDLTINPVK